MWHIHLSLAQMDVWWPGLLLLGGFIGILTGMFGVGGGFLLTPCLKILFGIPYPVAVGSGLAQIFLAGTYSTWKHGKNGNIDLRMGLLMTGGAVAGTDIGVSLLKQLGTGGTVILNSRTFTVADLVMSGLFLVLMTVTGLYIQHEASHSSGDEVASAIAQNLQGYRMPPQMAFPKSNIPSLSLWIPLIASFLVGILTGLLGVGGGFINFPLLVYVIGVPTYVAVGTSAFQILFASGYGALRHAWQGHVELLLVLLLLVGSLAGVRFGVYLSHLFGGRKLRKYFAWVIGLGIAVIIWDLVGEIWF
ncbi:hypothetical protein EDC14_103151 [Hydrogenispora ethanolica]|jgi:uncharacterized membrane protein YfcA|uniref:Probable membrane transporter protein n=1 Tax=Hydrogenispora ethanolica TaxID=1082276 RepID=A0A4R1R8K2_HYDET|nr:sulfite exporter TauE/SafE family protein [Hydrogenispora ethanolica]TCL61879.1 hypothetical protein EDC14_103151 [Hydrogenispora ethanolica]